MRFYTRLKRLRVLFASRRKERADEQTRIADLLITSWLL